MLLGQHLRRGEKRALQTARCGGKQRAHGDDRLAAADLALEEPAHRHVRRDIRKHGLEGVALIRGEVELERPEKRLKQAGARTDGHAPRPFPPLALSSLHRELVEKQFIKRQPPPRRLALLHCVRVVHPLDCFPQPRQDHALTDVRVQVLLE